MTKRHDRDQCAQLSRKLQYLRQRCNYMDTQLRQYLNGIVVLLSIVVGAVLTALVLPTTGEAMNTGSVLLWTAVVALLVGGSVYLAFLRGRPRRPELDAID